MNQKEFEASMRKVGKAAAKALNALAKAAMEGVTTNDLDKMAQELAASAGYLNAPLGYKGFPKSICTSLNDVMCHGVPDDVKLVKGDLLNIDITFKDPKTNCHGDTSLTLIVGEKDSALINAARAARDATISILRPDISTNYIGWFTKSQAYSSGFNVCKDIGGHGIGKEFHAEPYIPAFSTSPVGGPVLKKGMCITVEPILCEGTGAFKFEKVADSQIYKFICAQGLNSCQFEHTVLITDNGYEILTNE